MDQANESKIEVGDHVRVLKTSYTENRMPHVVGGVGKIKNIPLPPNTWYKVQFEFGTGTILYTLRNSCLTLVGKNTKLSLKNTAPFQLPKEDEIPAEWRTRRTEHSQEKSIFVNGALNDAFVRVDLSVLPEHTAPKSKCQGETGLITQVSRMALENGRTLIV